ncbi:MAG: hypothetical protein U0270_22475 [Labilithrix sp.]
MVLAKRKPSVTDPRKPRAIPERPTIPVGILLRMFLIGSVAVVASLYAVWRYYTTPYQKMLVPKPPASEVEIEWLSPPPADSK